MNKPAADSHEYNETLTLYAININDDLHELIVPDIMKPMTRILDTMSHKPPGLVTDELRACSHRFWF